MAITSEEWGEYKAKFDLHSERVEKMLTDHEQVLYGTGVDKPGLIGMVQESNETIQKIKKVALAAVLAVVSGLVGVAFKFLPLGKGN